MMFLLATIVHKAHKKKQPVGKPKNPFADLLEFLLLLPSASFVAITDVGEALGLADLINRTASGSYRSKNRGLSVNCYRRVPEVL
jgi:hypothetical protein